MKPRMAEEKHTCREKKRVAKRNARFDRKREKMEETDAECNDPENEGNERRNIRLTVRGIASDTCNASRL